MPNGIVRNGSHVMVGTPDPLDQPTSTETMEDTIERLTADNDQLRARLVEVERELRGHQEVEGTNAICFEKVCADRDRLRSLLAEACGIADDAIHGDDYRVQHDYGSMAQRIEQIRKEAGP